MKKWLLIGLLPLTVMAQKAPKPKPGKAPKVTKTAVAQPAGGLVVNGTVQGLADGMPISLIGSDGRGEVLATATVKKSKFQLKAKLPEPALYLLQLNPQQNIPLFVGNETITVTGDANQPSGINVKGSPLHDEFTEYSTMMQPLLEESNNIAYKAQTGGVSDSLRKAYLANNTAILAAADAYLGKKPASPVSALLLLVVKRFAPAGDYIEKRYNGLQPLAQQSVYGKILEQGINETKFGPTPVGSLAPDFSQNDVNGAPVSLSSFKGKYVLVDFWASWCRPCRDENPNVVQNYQRFKDKNFTVLGVSLDRAKDPWLQAIADDQLTWTHVSDLKFWSNEVAQLYKISSIPQNLLVGPDGKILAKNLRGPALESTLCQFLGCN
jgi:peroxiredoxin